MNQQRENRSNTLNDNIYKLKIERETGKIDVRIGNLEKRQNKIYREYENQGKIRYTIIKCKQNWNVYSVIFMDTNFKGI